MTHDVKLCEHDCPPILHGCSTCCAAYSKSYRSPRYHDNAIMGVMYLQISGKAEVSHFNPELECAVGRNTIFVISKIDTHLPWMAPRCSGITMLAKYRHNQRRQQIHSLSDRSGMGTRKSNAGPLLIQLRTSARYYSRSLKSMISITLTAFSIVGRYTMKHDGSKMLIDSSKPASTRCAPVISVPLGASRRRSAEQQRDMLINCTDISICQKP